MKLQYFGHWYAEHLHSLCWRVLWRAKNVKESLKAYSWMTSSMAEGAGRK